MELCFYGEHALAYLQPQLLDMMVSPTLVNIVWYPKVACRDMLGEQSHYSYPGEAQAYEMKYLMESLFCDVVEPLFNLCLWY